MKLIQGLQKLNFPQEEVDRLKPLMDSYINELVLFNSAYNLVNTNDRDEIIVRHILDSLSATEHIKALACERAAPLGKEAVAIADIGSGGGLPGIPLAAALPQYNFVLVERMSKRCAFLENAAAIQGLKNVVVKNLELEKTPAASFDIAAFRAFRPLDNKMLKSLLAVLKPGGFLAAYKARREKILEEMGALGYAEQDYKTIPLTVPFLTDTNSGDDRERNLVVISKKSF
ncbi:MAG: 16S rRNA (guanine(527)-N(7))-methyltransferase RsmG [Treponema sp.]|nr:16S rRNA (guanine(527)-N(7))-methyltransferase RsmG [Treponema sp.]